MFKERFGGPTMDIVAGIVESMLKPFVVAAPLTTNPEINVAVVGQAIISKEKDATKSNKNKNIFFT